ncbi:MAG: ribulokinase [Bacteroidota bacterium]
MNETSYVIGVDFGTDSVRAVIIQAQTGKEIAHAVHYYTRWKAGKYCDASINQFRQHPLDYVEGLEAAIQQALAQVSDGLASAIKGIAIDTTGSTPCAVDKSGTPLALTEGFQDNPNAMFILWKDHTAIDEAAAINELCAKWETDYTKYSGKIYSSEWFWAKIGHTLNVDESIRDAAYAWVEHCDWMPFLLTGGLAVKEMKRSRCAAGHKALWHPDWGGLPPNDFFVALNPLLDGLVDRLYSETYTSDVSAGTLSAVWADRLGLSTTVVVSVGAFDAHMGAVGGEIVPYHLSKIMGTSTCDILVAPMEEVGDKLVQGICGQVEGSVIPNMLGLEAGQSAFGDVYAWFKRLMMWSVEEVIVSSALLDEKTKASLLQDAADRMISMLNEAAEKVELGANHVVALDWLNGRRTPDTNQYLKGAVAGLDLSSDAPIIFRALVESTCFGARKIVERFQSEGIPIKGIIALGGVAKKSPFVMQTMADVLNRPIKVARSEQTVALGAAMFAATTAGIHQDIFSAMQAMGAGFDAHYAPRPEQVEQYNQLYAAYEELGNLLEGFYNNYRS